jgi:hypothetical protein
VRTGVTGQVALISLQYSWYVTEIGAVHVLISILFIANDDPAPVRQIDRIIIVVFEMEDAAISILHFIAHAVQPPFVNWARAPFVELDRFYYCRSICSMELTPSEPLITAICFAAAYDGWTILTMKGTETVPT